ncbi:MAG: hypothetical protein J0H19_02375 [Rhodospirillales bacterium]|nr:hypothetical protein [Rhodospirillales bacterium]MBN8902736.1 hypothetical protein [Rhodospirillales bacterium]MBN8925450.1 hypothetical protein [Rhodospirillales bacterium]
MRWCLLPLCLLAGCGLTPEQGLTVAAGTTIGSITIIHRSPFDAAYSLLTGRDCSIVRLDEGKSYCRPVEPPPEPPRFCTRSLGVVDCWLDPAKLPVPQREVADGPRVLTPEQEAYRTRRWP